MRKIKLRELTKEPSFFAAVKRVWEAGIEAFQKKATLIQLRKSKEKMEREHLEMSRLIHDYETKLQNLIGRREKLEKQNRELEWAYRALRRENRWLKEEIFSLKALGKED
ncbi:MAG: DUF342 domain-containing protein [Firmicutes bacterium]|nr:DUF342 domain-containing protein [Bacillota bacterium]